MKTAAVIAILSRPDGVFITASQGKFYKSSGFRRVLSVEVNVWILFRLQKKAAKYKKLVGFAAIPYLGVVIVCKNPYSQNAPKTSVRDTAQGGIKLVPRFYLYFYYPC
jgi:hypothetical protein